MAKTRVSELAKELGFDNAELLEELKALKIPVTSISSTLEPVYVKMAKQKLEPVVKKHKAEIAKKKAEEEAAAKKAAEAAAKKAEEERLAAEKRREEERAKERERQEAAEKRRQEEERERQEELKREEEEKERAKQAEIERKKAAAPKLDTQSYNTLLAQISAQEKILDKRRICRHFSAFFFIKTFQ